MQLPRVLVFAGSNRTGSYNAKLAGAITKTLGSMKCDVTRITLRDYEMPVYDADLEDREGPPEAALKLARLFHEQDAVIIVSPEYNTSIPPLVKNTLDWVSVVKSDSAGEVTPYKDKIFAIASASPGAFGGARSLMHLRGVLVNLGCLIVSEQMSVPRAADGFDDDEALADKRAQGLMEKLCKSVIEKAALLNRRYD